MKSTVIENVNECCLYNYETTCPILETHDRFIETWWFLVEATENYHNAKLFRWYLNAFIQSLRNVTFVLQSEKGHIPDFDVWYRNHQENMRNDPLLNAFVEGRNIVVKRGMLSSRSTAEAGLYRWYKLKIGYSDLELNIFNDSQVLLESIRDFYIGFMLDEEHSAIGEQIGISRRWIVDTLGDEEVISLCYQAWRRIGAVLEDAHNLFAIEMINPQFEIEMLDNKRILLESDIDPTLPSKWGWLD